MSRFAADKCSIRLLPTTLTLNILVEYDVDANNMPSFSGL